MSRCQILPTLLFIRLFNFAVSKTAKLSALYNYTTNNEMERIQKKSWMRSYYILPLNLSGPTEENHKKNSLKITSAHVTIRTTDLRNTNPNIYSYNKLPRLFTAWCTYARLSWHEIHWMSTQWGGRSAPIPQSARVVSETNGFDLNLV